MEGLGRLCRTASYRIVSFWGQERRFLSIVVVVKLGCFLLGSCPASITCFFEKASGILAKAARTSSLAGSILQAAVQVHMDQSAAVAIRWQFMLGLLSRSVYFVSPGSIPYNPL